jgi:predicted enzyme related to lactoylglutathione lyase
VLLASDDVTRASATSMPAGWTRGHPHWINYVRVDDDDAVATAAKVLALGGRVLVSLRIDRHGGELAVVADPRGAPFGLPEWAQSQQQEVAQGVASLHSGLFHPLPSVWR